ncbi:recombinase family protein [Paenibacillus sp. FSL W8-1287]|uniref:recombinase family protein n=1 Tax=Paenibacillus sp. FSL W8-1287 TaxID=2954653 RepID=UPI0030D3D183
MENQQQTRVSQARVALYARTNQASNEPNANSIEHQLDTMKAQCEREGKEIAAIFIDEGVSGNDLEQAHSMKKLLKEAAEGKFDEVLVHDLSRLGRKTVDVLGIVSELERIHVKVRLLAENFDTSAPMGKFVLQIMAAVLESGLPAEEITEAMNEGWKMRHA